MAGAGKRFLSSSLTQSGYHTHDVTDKWECLPELVKLLDRGMFKGIGNSCGICLIRNYSNVVDIVTALCGLNDLGLWGCPAGEETFPLASRAVFPNYCLWKTPKMIFRIIRNLTPENVNRPAKCDSGARSPITAKLSGNFICKELLSLSLFPPPPQLPNKSLRDISRNDWKFSRNFNIFIYLFHNFSRNPGRKTLLCRNCKAHRAFCWVGFGCTFAESRVASQRS